MTTSPAEALRILRKWANESTQVYVFVESGGVVLRLTGSILDISPLVIRVAQPGKELRRTEVAIGINDASGFDYTEMREAPEAVKASMGDWIVAGLAFNLPTAKVNIYELLNEAIAQT